MTLLSSFLNWGPPQSLNSETSAACLQSQPPLATEFLVDCTDGFDLLGIFQDPSYDTNFLYPENYTDLLPNLSSQYDPLAAFEVHDCDAYPYPKRQKFYNDHYYSDTTPTLLHDHTPSACSVTDFQALTQFGATATVEEGKKTTERCVSAQGIAARERRRKITEKTQALSKLIPGGNKMNTSEMLQAAFKYVKYLQAQVGILELMGSLQGNEEAAPTELQILGSPAIQEKLYVEDKCLVPKEFIRILANHMDIKSESSGLVGLIKLED